MMKLLRPETRENVREIVEEETENETRSFYTPTRSVRISSTQNDQNVCRNSDKLRFSMCNMWYFMTNLRQFSISILYFVYLFCSKTISTMHTKG